jgi:ankyrin repeat protein
MNPERSVTDAETFHQNMNFHRTQPNPQFSNVVFSQGNSVARSDELILAAHHGDFAQVQALLINGASASYHSPKSHRVTALCMAASKGHVKTMQLLLDYGADINAMTTAGFDALYFAAVSFQAEAVRFLLEKNARMKPYISYDHRVSLLMETLSILMPVRGMEMDQNKLSVVELLLQARISPNGCVHEYNCKHTSNHYPDSVLSPLIQIVKSDVCQISLKFKFTLCELLRKYGVNLDERDPHGNTALHYAVQFQCPEMASYLVDVGARTNNIMNLDQQTAR